MAQERGADTEKQIPIGCRWKDLKALSGKEQLKFYTTQLNHLSVHGQKRVRAIFAGAQTFIKNYRNLSILVDAIDQIEWFDADRAQFGDLYEGLLEKNAGEKKSGAGQYFTPRPLISSMVATIQPRAGEVIQDPAAGTGGFLIEADSFIKKSQGWKKLSTDRREFQRTKAFVGAELVPDTHRLCLMNMMLHDIDSDVRLGDALSGIGKRLPQSDVVLSNPPFGTKWGGGKPARDDLPFDTSNKQLNFLMHIYQSLKKPSDSNLGGRAAVIVPDNVLFEEEIASMVRQDLMSRCNLHTILRLPAGIFYAQGVKTNVLFFNRESEDQKEARDLWVYDLRTNMPSFGKRTPLTRDHFRDFEQAFGSDPWGRSPRDDQGPNGRFRRFTYDHIRHDRRYNLDITWLRDDTMPSLEYTETPRQITEKILSRLRSATAEIEELQTLLAGETSTRNLP